MCRPWCFWHLLSTFLPLSSSSPTTRPSLSLSHLQRNTRTNTINNYTISHPIPSKSLKSIHNPLFTHHFHLKDLVFLRLIYLFPLHPDSSILLLSSGLAVSEGKKMGSDLADPVLHEDSDPAEDASDGGHSNKKQRVKAPKKVLKAEREKLKREQLNEHFNRLAGVLELSDQNNGKASILNETIRLVNDMISQIQILRKENATLLSESHYMTTEKDELKDETSALEAQIKKMQSELNERLAQSKPDLNLNPPEYWQTEMASHFMEGHVSQLPTADPTSTQQPPIMGPLYVIPVGPNLQAFQKADANSAPRSVAVSKPHARYPTPADSWPLHLLSKQSEATS